MKRSLKIGSAITGAVALFALAAVAQTISIPQQSSVGSSDLIQVIPNGNPRVGNVYVKPAQLTSQSGYYKSAPATGFTFTFGNSQSFAAFAPSTTLSTGTVTLAPSPSDGARECIFTTNTITTLTVSANTGQSINNAVTTLSANTNACYLFSLSNLTWDRD